MGKALQMYPLIYKDEDNPTFKAGTGWLKRFKDRHGVRALAIQGESLSAADDNIESFKMKLAEIIEEGDLTLNQVFNCDETGLYWKLLPNKTLVSAREKEAKGFKKPKERVTIMACTNATGSIKFPLVFIHKSENPWCFKNIDKSDLPVDYYSQKSSWMDMRIFTEWLHTKFVSRCRREMAKRDLSHKALLLMDNAPSYPDSLQSDDKRITCLFLPANTTSLIQPLDQGVLEKVKRCYKRDLLLCMLNAEDSDSRTRFEDLSKTLSIKDAVFMSAKCWDEVGESTIVKSWSKLLSIPTSADELQQEDPGEDIETLLNSYNVPAQEREEWIAADANDPGYHEYTEDEIIKIAREEISGEQKEEEDEEEIDEQTVTHAQACEAAEILLKYLEQQPDIPVSSTILLNGLLMQAVRKRASSLKQTKLDNYFIHL